MVNRRCSELIRLLTAEEMSPLSRSRVLHSPLAPMLGSLGTRWRVSRGFPRNPRVPSPPTLAHSHGSHTSPPPRAYQIHHQDFALGVIHLPLTTELAAKPTDNRECSIILSLHIVFNPSLPPNAPRDLRLGSCQFTCQLMPSNWDTQKTRRAKSTAD